MKKSKIIYLIILCTTFSSCGDWLTINPQDQIKEGELYSKAEGYYNQINGIYKVMTDHELYGCELSFGLIEAMAQVYDSDDYGSSNIHEYKNAAKYSFLIQDRLKAMTVAIWEKGYNAISNCNSVIKYAEMADSMIFPRRELERQCILGEAYALRGMLHFDMMRVYAPSLIVNSKDSFIPYVKDFPIHIPTKTNTKEYINNVIEDLKKAHDLTRAIDSLSGDIRRLDSRLEFAGASGAGRFLSYRGYRLNFYAIKALLARVYLYAGQEKEALKYANELIDLHEKSRWFSFSSRYDLTSNGDSKLYGDVIFALYNNFQYLKFITVNPTIDETSKSDYLSLNDYAGIFGSEGAADYRALQLRLLSGNYIPNKFAEGTAGSKSKYANKMVPMLRMSEMYYIAAECLYDTDPVKAASYLSYVRAKRGVSAALPTTAKKDEFILQIINDVRREQMSEGQLFFFYKRLNLPVFTKNGEYVLPGPGFMLPIPDSNNIL